MKKALLFLILSTCGIVLASPVRSMLGSDGCEIIDYMLPYDSEVEYLRGDGNSYIDTGFIMPFNAEYTIVARRNTSTLPPYETICGCRKASFDLDFQATFYNGNLLMRNGRGSTQFANPVSGELFVISVNYAKALYINDIFTKDMGGGTYSPSLPLFVMALNQNGTPIQIAKENVDFFGMKVWDSIGILVLDLVPVRIGDGEEAEGCLFDRVSRTLMFNQGTGNFIIGPDKE